MAVINLEGVEVSYGIHKALNGVDLTLESGAIGLLGPNGAGKSTLMKTLLGFLRPERGSVGVLGMSMPEQALEIRQQLGYMPERDLMSPKVSAVSFLVYCGRLYGMTRPDAMERTHAVLNYVGLGESRYRKMETYSKGMCQRIKFAQAIIHDPKLLLLDEPTNGLDPDGRIEMLELIRGLAYRRKVAIVLSTHLLPDVERVCDHLVIINEGVIVREGSLKELTTVRDGLFEVRVNDNQEGFLAALKRHGFTWKNQYDGSVLVRMPNGLSARDVFEAAREQRTYIRHFKPIRQRLEETFMEAIGKAPAGTDAAAHPPPLPVTDEKIEQPAAGGGD